MGKKQFIDKRNARVFRLVNRSVVEDPEQVDETGAPLPDRVFAEVTPAGHGFHDDELDGEGEEAIIDVGDREPSLAEVKAGEAANYGIFYDDREYDYTQHLKPIGQTPGAVFVAAPASTVEHGSSGDLLPSPEEAEAILNKATYENIHQTDADPAVLEVLEALDDDAFIDEDAFDDDFIVKLDREEARILAPYECRQRKSKELDSDFEKLLQMYSDSEYEEYEDCEEGYYSDDQDDEEIDVENLDDALPFSKGGPSRMYQLDQVRKELRDGDAALLDLILYTTDEEDGVENQMEVVEIDTISDVRMLNCQTACKFLASRSRSGKVHRPKIIREDLHQAVDPIRISRKTGMPLMHEHGSEEEKERGATLDEEPVNKGVPRPKEETVEEKRARKAAIKAEQRSRRVNRKAGISA